MIDLTGCYTALVTPFEGGQVCFPALTDLVEAQLAGGVDGLVPVGTTGESPTLGMADHCKVIEHVINAAAGRCRVIAGSGGNATDEALELTRCAKVAGADASLQVTPYYNKPTQEGLYRHFATVAETVGLPVVLYNVPGRTGREIAVETIARLAGIAPVVAVKEAGGSVDRVSQILAQCDITVLSGDDQLTLPMMSVGGRGVISVASNVVPAEMAGMVHQALAGDWPAAKASHYRLYPLFKALFFETNPIPVKAALAAMGRIREEYRLPLCEMAPDNREKLLAVLRQLGLIAT